MWNDLCEDLTRHGLTATQIGLLRDAVIKARDVYRGYGMLIWDEDYQAILVKLGEAEANDV